MARNLVPQRNLIDEEIAVLEHRLIDAMRIYRELRLMLATAKRRRDALRIIPQHRRAA